MSAEKVKLEDMTVAQLDGLVGLLNDELESKRRAVKAELGRVQTVLNAKLSEQSAVKKVAAMSSAERKAVAKILGVSSICPPAEQVGTPTAKE